MQSTQHVERCISAIAAAVREGDGDVQGALIDNVEFFPESWQDRFADALKDLTDEESPAVFLHDGRPFLSEPTSASDEDIPF